ncbi:permease of the major facilitator [Aspergillus oryzae 100-8]|uniref:Permease of the major facilitator superfamily n=1 Tax=Aspergillus oryzae (strain 3.042) TaxID=1160506 RepID=I8A3Y7_ASPO3|nr:permease of the major facilitator superfamily [Aspergillus oryzae 3.042]KDE83775.1 permease of the major facilitator [Aspergillus oryzae 100-8]|eukprot:EIT79204.1 permease of the major facilitator superfamily [Aspergillus oryzae 3.042]
MSESPMEKFSQGNNLLVRILLQDADSRIVGYSKKGTIALPRWRNAGRAQHIRLVRMRIALKAGPAEIQIRPVDCLKVKLAPSAEPVSGQNKPYRSGDPRLAVVDEEAEQPPKFDDLYQERRYLKHRLALAFRIFAKFDLSEGVAGHITVRDPVDPTSFWVNPFGMHFSLIEDDDLIRVDHSGTVVEGGKNKRLNYGILVIKFLTSPAAYAIHAEIHRARPDVLCAAHSHSLYGRAICATGKTLDMLTQDFCVFWNDHVLYSNFAGLVLAADEGKAIAAALGNKKAALLGNHGILTVGPTIEATVAWFVLLERCCQIQLAADASAAGTGRPLVTIGEDEARATWEAVGTIGNGYFQGLPLFQVAEREFGERTLLDRSFPCKIIVPHSRTHRPCLLANNLSKYESSPLISSGNTGHLKIPGDGILSRWRCFPNSDIRRMSPISIDLPSRSSSVGFFKAKGSAIHMESTTPANLDIDGKDGNGELDTQSVIVDEETNKRLLRKIDIRLMPVKPFGITYNGRKMCFTYALQYYDKALLSQAAIFGLREDLDLQSGLRYSWITWVSQKVTVARVCPIICILWSLIVLCTPACSTYTGILINRFMLGVIESGVSPAFMLCTGAWYTHSEQVLRSSLWYSFSGGSNIISPLINYGLGHITSGSLHPWQYMYLIAGLATLAWAIALFFVFPGSPQTAKGFTAEERMMLLERVRANNAGAENRTFKWYQVCEALYSYHFWCIFLLSTLSSTGSGAVTTFGSIIFNGMGFSTFESLLLNIPIGALAFICVLGSGYIGRKYPNARLHTVSASCIPVIVGGCMLWRLPSSKTAARIIGFYLINFFSAAWVQCIAMGTSNVAGYTKKATMAAGTFMGYSLGNIIGPLTFDARYAPRYDPGFEALIICFAIALVLSQVFRALMALQNHRRDQRVGPPTAECGLQDLTDKENKSFRYPL